MASATIKTLISIYKQYINMVILLENKRLACEYVLNVKKSKSHQIFGRLAHIVKNAKKNIGEIVWKRINRLIQIDEKIYGLKTKQESVLTAKLNLLGKKDYIVVPNVVSYIKSLKMKMDVGNGKDYLMLEDMDILQTIQLEKDVLLIDIVTKYIEVKSPITFMYATNVTIQNVVLQITYFWEQIKKICKIAKIKVEQLKAIKLQERVKIIKIQNSTDKTEMI